MFKHIAFFALLFAGSAAFAQVTAPDTPSRSPNDTPRIDETPVPVYYVRDAKGQYIALLQGVKYEEIAQFITNRMARTDRTKPNRLTISNVDIVATAEENLVRLKATVVFQVQADADDNEATEQDWVRVPLGFHAASLESPPRFDGDGDCVFLHEEADGFVAWYRGDSTEPNSVTLDLVQSTKRIAETTELEFRLPEATRSTLAATIPGELNNAEVTGGTVSDQYADEGSVFVKCVGLQSEFRLAWSQGVAAKSEAPTRLDVTGEIDATIERIGLITSIVKLLL